MENLTLESLPKAVSLIAHEIGELKRMLLQFEDSKIQQSTDSWFDLSELCEYLPDKPAKATVYAWAQKNLIPYHKGGKKLRFLKSEIDYWLKQGKKKSLEEFAIEADQYLVKKKGGKHV